jgi:opacity protein-like surface antigen
MAFLGPANGVIRPYILGGGGWYFTTIDRDFPGGGDDSDTDNRFGTHAGGGLLLRMTPGFSISGDYRYIWLQEFQTRDESLDEIEFDDSGSQVTVALNFHF